MKIVKNTVQNPIMFSLLLNTTKKKHKILTFAGASKCLESTQIE